MDFIQSGYKQFKNTIDPGIKGFDRVEATLSPPEKTVSFIQKKIDSISRRLDILLDPLRKVDDWIHTSPKRGFADRIIIHIVKLPLRAGRNITVIFYKIFLSEIRRVRQLIIWIAEDVFSPRNWVILGAVRAGALFVGAFMCGYQISPLSLFILGGGMSMGMLIMMGKTIYDYRHQQVHDKSFFEYMEESFLKGFDQVSEAFATGAFAGLFFRVLKAVVF